MNRMKIDLEILLASKLPHLFLFTLGFFLNMALSASVCPVSDSALRIQSPGAKASAPKLGRPFLSVNDCFTVEGFVRFPKEAFTDCILLGDTRVFKISVVGTISSLGEPRYTIKFLTSSNSIQNQLEGVETNEILMAQGFWHHIACVFDTEKNERRIYLNGMEQLKCSLGQPECKDITENVPPPSNNGEQEIPDEIVVGNLSDTSDYLIDEIRVSKAVRYDKDFVPPANPFDPDDPELLALWSFEEKEDATSFVDSSSNNWDLKTESDSALTAPTSNNRPMLEAILIPPETEITLEMNGPKTIDIITIEENSADTFEIDFGECKNFGDNSDNGRQIHLNPTEDDVGTECTITATVRRGSSPMELELECDSESFAVNIIRNFRPVVTPGQVFEVAENSMPGTPVLPSPGRGPEESKAVLATDESAMTNLQAFTIEQGSDKFTIDSNGNITVDKEGLNFEETSSFQLGITVSDSSGTETERSEPGIVMIKLKNINDRPKIDPEQMFELWENIGQWENPPEGRVVGTLRASDEDTDAILQEYTIMSGNGEGNFFIDPSNGVISVAAGALLNSEINSSFDLGFTVSDGDLTSDPEVMITFKLKKVTDMDHDLLDDMWEKVYLGDGHFNGEDDPDADGLSNKDEFFNSFIVGGDFPFALRMEFVKGWNLISVPKAPEENLVEMVFPGDKFPYRFWTWNIETNLYEIATHIHSSNGYWSYAPESYLGENALIIEMENSIQ